MIYMELRKYSVERQKKIVKDWNYYYSKGIRDPYDFQNFNRLLDERLDDLLKLMALENLTSFASNFKNWPRNFSLCNMIYTLSLSSRIDSQGHTLSVDSFLDMVRTYFDNYGWNGSFEEVIEMTLDYFEPIFNADAETQVAQRNIDNLLKSL